MRTADLNHTELLELQPALGLVRFAGRRALMIDAFAMGLLRKSLVENVGALAARSVLTQFGVSQGVRTAQTMKSRHPADSDSDWLRAGLRIHALEGYFTVAPEGVDPLSPDGLTVLGSFEAEQQVEQLGVALTPSCWTIAGLLSGYASLVTGREHLAVEDRCVALGHAACHFMLKARDAWADHPAVRFFDPRPLDELLGESLRAVSQTLASTEAQLTARRRTLLKATAETTAPDGLVARSEPMQALVALVRLIARVDATVLITGESGTGKERIARLVHDLSTRVSGPFVAVNCGAITETLLESELFGHARGAFTGANQDRAGLFEAANGGTLLLDEVGEVSPGMQVKLLRVLQEREVRRVGENKSRRVDVRVLAATNRDLAHGVAGGAFRQDLYYRLKVVELRVPPLRERMADILPLARALLQSAAEQMKRTAPAFSPDAAELLLHYPWPGNVRELENAMERAAALTQGQSVEATDLPSELRVLLTVSNPEPGVRPLADVERDYIVTALERNGGNQTHTAQQLKIGSATLYRKLRSYGLTRSRNRS